MSFSVTKTAKKYMLEELNFVIKLLDQYTVPVELFCGLCFVDYLLHKVAISTTTSIT